MVSHARPAACEAAGLVAGSLRFGLDFLLLAACFLGSLLRRVDNIGGVCCRSVLEERDLLVLDLWDDVECMRVGSDSNPAAGAFCATESALVLV